jgi:hypothetical protein
MIKAALPSRSGVSEVGTGEVTQRVSTTTLDLGSCHLWPRRRAARDLGASACLIHAHAILMNSYLTGLGARQISRSRF